MTLALKARVLYRGIMNQKNGTRNIVITGLLLALEIVFQILGNYFQIGLVNINLTLITVVLAGVLCGPMSAAILGFFNGVMALFAPATLAVFIPISPYGTIVVCLMKCTIAGIAASYVYKLLKTKNKLVALVTASAIVPILNTGIFCLGCLLFFRPFLESGVNETFPNTAAFLVFGVIGWNFILELVSTMVLSPTVGMILLKREEKKSL